MKNYYSLLGVDSKATKKEIRKNYHLLATKFHPDKSKDPDSATKFIAITEAYDVLSNRKSRAEYDLKRWEVLNKANKSSDSFTVVSPPTESLRSRRIKAQKQRAAYYFQSEHNIKKIAKLLVEGLHIASRYIFHVIGIALLGFVAFSAASQIDIAFSDGLVIGIGVCLFIVALLYGIYKILRNFFMDFSVDIKTFSVNYKIPTKKAASYSLFVFSLALLIFAVFVIS